MTTCNGCGQCCNPVVMPENLTDMRLRRFGAPPDEAQNIDFALAHFTPLSRREGRARAPWLAAVQDNSCEMVDRFGQVQEPMFFECDMYDPVEKRCTDYAGRPPFCADYPWYGGGPNVGVLPDQCSFREDQPVDVRRMYDKLLAERSATRDGHDTETRTGRD